MSHYSDIIDRLQDADKPRVSLPHANVWQQPHLTPAHPWRHPFVEPTTLNIPKSALGMRTHPKEGPVKSDGGSSSYYDFTIHSSYGGSLKVKTGDVIRAMVGNDFNLGNIIKACRRVSEAMNGRGKAGTGVEYDLTKIAYFAEELKAALAPTKTETPVQPNECWEEVNAKLEVKAKEEAKEEEKVLDEEVLAYDGQRYTVMPFTTCGECAFTKDKAACLVVPCVPSRRTDGRSVIFVKEPANG